MKLNKLFSKLDSLVESSQKLWSLIGYIVSPMDKINSKSIEKLASYIKSIKSIFYINEEGKNNKCY